MFLALYKRACSIDAKTFIKNYCIDNKKAYKNSHIHTYIFKCYI